MKYRGQECSTVERRDALGIYVDHVLDGKVVVSECRERFLSPEETAAAAAESAEIEVARVAAVRRAAAQELLLADKLKDTAAIDAQVAKMSAASAASVEEVKL